jgi:hypothetical protein
VHSLEIAYPMASSMAIIHLVLPKSSSSQHVDIATVNIGVLRPDQSLNVEVAQ